MRMGRLRRALLCLMAAVLVFSMGGCQPSRKKVVNSKYYKKLKKENEKLKKENEKLQSQVDKDNNMSEDEQRAEDYLGKIARDSLTKLEVGFSDNMEGSEFVEDKGLFSFATSIAGRADKTSRYSPEEVEAMYGPGYEYILYDEDNAVYELKVYGSDYVVFTDLPERVYYSYNASSLGEAILHYKKGYPDSKLLHRIADVPLGTDKKGNYYMNEAFADFAIALINMEDREKTGRDNAQKYWKEHNIKNVEQKAKRYNMYHHGNQMTLTLYDCFIRIENMDSHVTWYKLTEEEVSTLKKIFPEARKKQKENDGDGRDKKSDNVSSDNSSGDDSHYDEMDSDSDVNEQ